MSTAPAPPSPQDSEQRYDRARNLSCPELVLIAAQETSYMRFLDACQAAQVSPNDI